MKSGGVRETWTRPVTLLRSGVASGLMEPQRIMSGACSGTGAGASGPTTGLKTFGRAAIGLGVL